MDQEQVAGTSRSIIDETATIEDEVDVIVAVQQPADISLEFRVFLVNSDTGEHIHKTQTLRYWFWKNSENRGLTNTEKASIALNFFKELVSPPEFPQDDESFKYKIETLRKNEYPSTIFKMDLETKELETNKSANQSIIAIITAQYCEKNPLDKIYVRYTKIDHDPHSVSKQLQMEQWMRLFGSKLLMDSTAETALLSFISQVILHDECWMNVNSLKGIELDRKKVGEKLLDQTTSNSDNNPLNDMQKYKIACWCCFEDKIQELGNKLQEQKNNFTAHGPLVNYWTHFIFYKDTLPISDYSDCWSFPHQHLEIIESDEIRFGFESALRDNNREALEYFWEKIKSSLSEKDQNELLIFTATHYYLPYSKANNEKVDFVMDRLDQNKYPELLQVDFNENGYYSTLYHLISNCEFARAKNLSGHLSPEITSYFDYNTLKYCILHKISHLPSDSTFYKEGNELLSSLNTLSNSIGLSQEDRNDIFKLREMVNSHLDKILELKDKFNIHHGFDESILHRILNNIEVITLNQTAIEKASERFYLSDYEDTVWAYDKYKAEEKLKKFKRYNENFGNNFSFVAHAVSIKLLYSSVIQKAYYEKKNPCKKHRDAPDYNEICVAVDHTAEHIAINPRVYFKQVVAYDICNTINADPFSFVCAIDNKKLGSFFNDLQKPKGIYVEDHLSRGLESGGISKLVFTDSNDSEPHEKRRKIDVSQSHGNFAIKFFSDLRLYNRLQKRNLKGSDYNEPFTWEYSNSVKVETKGKYREDRVIFGIFGDASYETIYKDVTFTMRDLEALPTIFTAKEECKLSNHAANLHLLLFGVEVMRNPSALIHNMMMFELIRGGKYTLKDFFIDKKMPMSMKGAVMASRIKNSKYNKNYMPHKYLYELKTYEQYSADWNQNYDKFNNDDANKLFDKEKAITLEWLKMKDPSLEEKQYFDEKSDIKVEHVGWLFNLLQESCKAWYNIDLLENCQ